MIGDKIQLFAHFAEVGAIVLGAVVNIMIWLHTLHQLKKSSRKDTTNRTIQLLTKLGDKISEIEKVFPPNKWSARPIPLWEIRHVVQNNQLALATLSDLCCQLDFLAYSIESRLIDESLAIEMIGWQFVQMKIRLEKFIEMEQRLRFPHVYSRFIALALHWQKALSHPSASVE